MFKELLTLFFAIASISECSIVKISPYIPRDQHEFPNNHLVTSPEDVVSNWSPHVIDFLKLMDVEKMVMVAMQYIGDPEVMMFMKFLFSPQFKDLVWDFETMEEFKEAFAFLESKGYDMESVINYVNSALNLPPFEKPSFILRNKNGISGFLEAMVDTLPLEEMKKLFESKLETSTEVANLFDTINSQEFMDIMRKMKNNSKFTEFKMVFEQYGFDFEVLCKLFKDIFGEYYQGIFCE